MRRRCTRAKGVSYGLRGNYHFLVRKAYTDALRDATAARKAHFRVTEIDPSFEDALLVQGVYDYVLGSLSPAWRVLGFFAGFRGDRERGVETLKQVAKLGRRNRVDAEILLCAAYRRERRAKGGGAAALRSDPAFSTELPITLGTGADVRRPGRKREGAGGNRRRGSAQARENAWI